jgi:hypothetical protein
VEAADEQMPAALIGTGADGMTTAQRTRRRK